MARTTDPGTNRRPRRVALATVAALTALFLASVLSKAWPGTFLDGALALPRHLRIDSAGATGPLWPLLLPLAAFAGAWRLRARGRMASGGPAGTAPWSTRPLETGALAAALAFGLFLPPPGLLVIAAVGGAAWWVAGRFEPAPGLLAGAGDLRASLARESWVMGVALYTAAMAAHVAWLGAAGVAWACAVAAWNVVSARQGRLGQAGARRSRPAGP